MRHPIAVVFRKEVRDNLRDRRSLVSALIYPMLGPLVFALLLGFVAGIGSGAKLSKAIELILLMVPAFVMFTLFIGGVYLAIDSIAGERERGSFEPLMANPVPRWNILAGKALAAGLFTWGAVALQLAAFLWVLAPFDALFVSGTRFDAAKALAALPLLPPMLALAVAVQMLIAITTRSLKEAQTWLGLMPLVPATPGMILAMLPADGNGWAKFVPLLSQTVAMQDMIRGAPVPLSHHLTGACVTVAVAALFYWIAARRLEREDAVFGTAG